MPYDSEDWDDDITGPPPEILNQEGNPNHG